MKLFKSKKAIISLALVAVMAAAGVTYAWFTSSARAESNASVGRLLVEARQFEEYFDFWDFALNSKKTVTRVYTDDPAINDYRGNPDWLQYFGEDEQENTYWIGDNMFFEPGQKMAFGFEVSNPQNPWRGNALSEIVKVADYEGNMTIRYNAAGEIINDWVVTFAELEAMYGDLLDLNMVVRPMNIVDANGAVLWLYDQSKFDAEGVYEFYVIMSPGTQLDVVGALELSGEMGNQFQESEINLDIVFDATQTLDAAVESMWPGVVLAYYDPAWDTDPGTVGIQMARASAQLSVEEIMRTYFPGLTVR